MDDLSLAKKLLEIGDKNGALKELSRILKSNPNNIEAWLLCAQASEDIDYQKDCYRAVLKLDPNNIEAAKELKKLVSPPLSDTQPHVVSEASQHNQQKIDLSAVESKGKDLIRFLLSDKGFKIAVLVMIGIILLVFGISFLINPKEQVDLQPTSTSVQPLIIIVKPPNTTITAPPTYTPQPTKTPYPTHAPTPYLWPGPAKSYIPFENENLQLNYLTTTVDAKTTEELDWYGISFTPYDLLHEPAYNIIVGVANTIDVSKEKYNILFTTYTSDNGDDHYELLYYPYSNSLLDEEFTFGGTNYGAKMIYYGRGFRIKNVFITITICIFAQGFTESDTPRIIQDLDTMTEIVLEKFR